MKKSIFILAFLCTLFSGCQKADETQETGEDLSYLIMTYQRYESNGHIYKTTWTYDGYKPMGKQYYVDGELISEYKNYSYDGLHVSWDYYNYRLAHYDHYETEYLDETFLRIKYQKTQSYYLNNPQDNTIYEHYYEYDGKKMVSSKSYQNGILTQENHDYNYDGLHCTYKTTYYSSSNPDVIWQERIYSYTYLDDTFMRYKLMTRTENRYVEGVLYDSNTRYSVINFDGKKPIGGQTLVNGEISSVSRDHHYDGLTCYYYVDNYQDGQVTSTQMYEVEYLE